jgi:hypothetical protein
MLHLATIVFFSSISTAIFPSTGQNFSLAPSHYFTPDHSENPFNIFKGGTTRTNLRIYLFEVLEQWLVWLVSTYLKSTIALITVALLISYR